MLRIRYTDHPSSAAVPYAIRPNASAPNPSRPVALRTTGDQDLKHVLQAAASLHLHATIWPVLDLNWATGKQL